MNALTKNYCCIDCGNLICSRTADYGTGRCASCANTGHRNNMFKNGIWKNKHFCIDCNKKISYESYKYGTKRCVKCSGKYYSNQNRYWNWRVDYQNVKIVVGNLAPVVL